jgi:hypothetical protein
MKFGAEKLLLKSLESWTNVTVLFLPLIESALVSPVTTTKATVNEPA